MPNSKQKFSAGDRIKISESHHWAKNALGTINNPEYIDWLEGYENGCSREVESLQGILTFYWVDFDEPQMDADGDGPYYSAEIDSEYLTKI